MFCKVGMGAGLLLPLTASCENCDQEVHARPYDIERNCFAEQQRVGCVPLGRSCPPSIKYAVDKTGRCFAFPDCLPEDFAQAEPGGSCPPSDGPKDCGPVMADLLPDKPLQTDESHDIQLGTWWGCQLPRSRYRLERASPLNARVVRQTGTCSAGFVDGSSAASASGRPSVEPSRRSRGLGAARSAGWASFRVTIAGRSSGSALAIPDPPIEAGFSCPPIATAGFES